MRYLLPVLTFFLVLPCLTAESPAPLPAATTWFGNSFSGATKHMQRSIYGFYVGRDGTCYTNSGWDEGGYAAGVYRDGEVVGRLPGIQVTRGLCGGRAVTGSGTYIYYSAQRTAQDDKTKREWYVGRCFLDTRPAPWAGAADALLLVAKTPLQAREEGACGEIFGLAVTNGELFVATSAPDLVQVYDAETMAKKREFPCVHPGPMAADGKGNLWIVQRPEIPGHSLESADNGGGFSIVQYSIDGKLTGKLISDAGRPRGLALDRQGRLLVANDGPEQNIAIYDLANPLPKLAGTFGENGGILATPRGRFAPRRLNYPVGVGVDQDGRYYVAENFPYTGAAIQQYLPAGTPGWQLYSTEYMNSADADPGDDGATIYSPFNVFTMDYAKQKGQEARWIGQTIDKFRYPDDPRLHASNFPGFAPLLRRLNGRLYLYMVGENGWLSIFKQEEGSLIFAPCGIYATRHLTGAWPAGQPAAGRWLWRDADGDGAIDANEYDTATGEAGGEWSLWVDRNGGLWYATAGLQIVHLPLQGFDNQGNPHYIFGTATTTPLPAPFPQEAPTDGLLHRVCRLEYHEDSDTLYVSGFTAGEHAVKNERGIIRTDTFGAEVFRFDQWSKNDRVLRWRIPVAFVPRDSTACCNAFTVSGNYLFVGAVGGGGNQNKIWVYDTATGKEQGLLTPGKEIGGIFGWIDITRGLRSYARKNGEILVFVEDVWKEKQVVYRMTTKQ